ncbi:MAG: membrane dipeptidase [Clostridia bacterium]|nr:membrane dipeptidase [Clostridia bacterium]
MDYFDLHCDTATEIFKRREKLFENGRHVSLSKAGCLEKYAQVAAFWSDPKNGDDCFRLFVEALDYFEAELSENGLLPVTDRRTFEKLQSEGKPAFILAIEGANLFSGDTGRLEAAYSRGIRVITPVWKGVSCIGGAFDTDVGLTPFGYGIIRRMGELNIACDLSHASVKTADEALSEAKKHGFPVFCSHSNSHSLCSHPRCITDGFAKRLAEAGGICGVSFVPYHLADGGVCKAEAVVSHLLRFYNIAGADFPALGGDFDGVDLLPEGISDISDVPAVLHLLEKHGLSDGEIEKILYLNAKRFLLSVLDK